MTVVVVVVMKSDVCFYRYDNTYTYPHTCVYTMHLCKGGTPIQTLVTNLMCHRQIVRVSLTRNQKEKKGREKVNEKMCD